jgi:O-glycosyl hydrolase
MELRGRYLIGLAVLALSIALASGTPARAAVSPWDVEVVQTSANLSQRMTRLPELRLSAVPPAPCARSELRLSAGAPMLSGGSYAQLVRISNPHGRSCSLRGYPALRLLSRRGRVLVVPERHGGSALFADHGYRSATLGPGGIASFAFGGREAERRRPCPRATRIALTLPAVPGQFRIPHGAPACRSGISITPVGPGPDSSAFGTPVPVVGVNARVRYQSILGVGAAMTDSSAWLIYDELDPAARAQLIGRLFGGGGLRLPFTLVPMGASDFTAQGVPYTYDDMPAGESDPTLADFSIAHDQAYVLPALRALLGAAPHEQIFAVPWSAPAWMKANDALDDLRYGGTLLPADYAPWAQYFVKFLQAYAAAGVPVSAIAPENEPTAPAAFPAMSFPEIDEAQWIAEDLQPALAQAGLRPAIYGYDDSWRSPAYPEALAASPAGADLAGIAWHCYRGMPTVMDALHARSPALAQIVTECSPGISPYNASELMIGAFRHWATTAALWNLALDPAGGPVQPPNSGCRGCTGVVTIDPGSGQVSYNPAYYRLGQLSRFVVPGARRIASPSFVRYYRSGSSNRITPGLADVAFRNPDGSLVLLAYNSSSQAIGLTIEWAGRSADYTLPAGATVTLVWNRH